MLRASAFVARRLVLRTQHPLRGMWRVLYDAILRAVVGHVRCGDDDATVYVRGTLGFGEPVYGLSDIDLVVVVPDDHEQPGRRRRRVRERFDALCRRVSPLGDLVGVMIYEETELRDATSTTSVTYGLGTGDAAASMRDVFFAPQRLADELWLRVRPGLYGPAADWRLVAGAERRHVKEYRNRQERRIAAWLELQYWWRWALRAFAGSRSPHAASLAVKLVAEPVRILLWLAHGERVFSRSEALRRGLGLLPDEEAAVRLALALERRVARNPPLALEESLPALVRLSRRIATLIADELEQEATATEVRLAGADSADTTLRARSRAALDALDAQGHRPRLLPLADWRALVLPALGDEALVLLDADASDLETLVGIGRFEHPGLSPALQAGELLVLPSTEPKWRSMLRAVQCAPTDPVSFALAAGAETARFPDVVGWSAQDIARRAVAEHRAWLRAQDGVPPPTLASLALLLTGARAALFFDTVERGEPELPLTAAAVAAAFAKRDDGADAAAAGAAAYRDARVDERSPDAEVVAALYDLLRRLLLAESRSPRGARAPAASA